MAENRCLATYGVREFAPEAGNVLAHVTFYCQREAGHEGRHRCGALTLREWDWEAGQQEDGSGDDD